ncbi:MAG: ATP-binding protein [Candidatus Helarchaeota archaeon]
MNEIIKFKDRKKEVSELSDLLNKPTFQFIIIYGRRRIGKTMLALHTTRSTNRVYFLAEKIENLPRFVKACSSIVPEIVNLKNDFHLLLNYLKDKVDIIIIDEFPNMVSENENILNIFQNSIDTDLKNSSLKLIVLGSSISLMTSKVLSSPSPLYGRKTASFKLSPISFLDLGEFFPGKNLEELLEIYGFADGIPYYLEQINKEEPFWDWLNKNLKLRSTFLKDEIYFLMRYEFHKPENYLRILRAVALGNTKMNQIAMASKMKITDIPPYLNTLIEVDFIIKQIPFGEKLISRSGRYFLNDNFLKFWFRFIFPNLSSIEQGIFDVELIKSQYNQYLGPIFENVVQQFLIEKKIHPLTRIGRWWWKAHEIDLVGFDEKTRSAIFVECKWQNSIKPKTIAAKLVEKIPHVRLKYDSAKILLFAKDFTEKITEFEGFEVECWDLDRMQALINL